MSTGALNERSRPASTAGKLEARQDYLFTSQGHNTSTYADPVQDVRKPNAQESDPCAAFAGGFHKLANGAEPLRILPMRMILII